MESERSLPFGLLDDFENFERKLGAMTIDYISYDVRVVRQIVIKHTSVKLAVRSPRQVESQLCINNWPMVGLGRPYT